SSDLPRSNDCSVGGAPYRSAMRGGIIGAQMRSVGFQHGMKTPFLVAGGNAGKIQGGFQKKAFQSLPFFVVVIRTPFYAVALITEGIKSFAFMLKHSGLNIFNTCIDTVIDIFYIINQFKTISFLKPEKVDFPLIYFCQFIAEHRIVYGFGLRGIDDSRYCISANSKGGLRFVSHISV